MIDAYIKMLDANKSSVALVQGPKHVGNLSPSDLRVVGTDRLYTSLIVSFKLSSPSPSLFCSFPSLSSFFPSLFLSSLSSPLSFSFPSPCCSPSSFPSPSPYPYPCTHFLPSSPIPSEFNVFLLGNGLQMFEKLLQSSNTIHGHQNFVLSPTSSVKDVLAHFVEKKVHRLYVVEGDGHSVGVVSPCDVLKLFATVH